MTEPAWRDPFGRWTPLLRPLWNLLVGRWAPLLLLRHALAGRLDRRRVLADAWRARRFRFVSKAEADIFWNVVVRDEYGLTTWTLRPEDVVLDVGGHVGSFGFACHRAGSRNVFSYEPHPELASRMARHYSALRGVHTTRAAVFRSDLAVRTLPHSGWRDDPNTGSGSVLFDARSVTTTVDVPVVALDAVLAPHPRVALLKLDCEGAEFPILLTSSLLARVERVVAECHEIGPEAFDRLLPEARLPGRDRYALADLEACLAGAGFCVRLRQGPPGYAWLSAER